MSSTRDWTLPDKFAPASLPHKHPLASWWTTHANSPFTDHNATTAFPPPELQDASATVTVIGSGMTGICTVFHLVSSLPSGASVVVLEARSFCSGATGRNGGHLATQTKYFFGDIADKTGAEDAIAADKLEEKSESWLLDMAHSNGWSEDLLLNEGGDVIFFDSPDEVAEFKSGVERATQLGLDTSKFKYYTAEDCQREWRVKAPHGACWHPAANFFPLRFVSRLFQKALDVAAERGVSLLLYTHAPVTSVEAASDSAWRVEVDQRGSLTSRSVVHATNAYASHLLPSYARGSQRIVPTRGQVSSFFGPSSTPHQPHERWRAGLAAGGDGNYYMFETVPLVDQHESTRVILGGGRLFADPGLEWGVTDDSMIHEDVSRGTKDWLEQFAPGRKWERETEWTGIMAFTPTHAPFVGPAYEGRNALKGQFIAAGFNGHGMPRCPAAAQAVAEMVCAYIGNQQWSRPDWLPSYFLTRPHEREHASHHDESTVVNSFTSDNEKELSVEDDKLQTVQQGSTEQSKQCWCCVMS